MLKVLNQEEIKANYPHAFSDTVVREVMQRGLSIRVKARGSSMVPLIHTGDVLFVEPVKLEQLKVGDIIVFDNNSVSYVAHRIIKKNDSTVTTKGDNQFHFDRPIPNEHVRGKITQIENKQKQLKLDRWPCRVYTPFLVLSAKVHFRGQYRLTRILCGLCWRIGGKKIS
jgi:signal peptidase I